MIQYRQVNREVYSDMKVIEHNKVAEYLRLSREDGDKMESDSIKNQRDLVRDYLAKHPDLRHVAEYVDDGYSGTNFERPGFQKMMKDIQAGKINCIIVKDLSRFGRNYIEVGKYLERLFPSIGVRLISILDQYDSAKENSDADRRTDHGFRSADWKSLLLSVQRYRGEG